MGATAPINFEKSLIAPIDFYEKHYNVHRFWQSSSKNGGYTETLHPSIKISKDGSERDIANDLFISKKCCFCDCYLIRSE